MAEETEQTKFSSKLYPLLSWFSSLCFLDFCYMGILILQITLTSVKSQRLERSIKYFELLEENSL